MPCQVLGFTAEGKGRGDPPWLAIWLCCTIGGRRRGAAIGHAPLGTTCATKLGCTRVPFIRVPFTRVPGTACSAGVETRMGEEMGEVMWHDITWL